MTTDGIPDQGHEGWSMADGCLVVYTAYTKRKLVWLTHASTPDTYTVHYLDFSSGGFSGSSGTHDPTLMEPPSTELDFWQGHLWGSVRNEAGLQSRLKEVQEDIRVAKRALEGIS